MSKQQATQPVYIQIKKGNLKTVILACDYDKAAKGVASYKDLGWKPVKGDWTKERTINPPINVGAETEIKKLGESTKR